jgi:hypothetical protein
VDIDPATIELATGVHPALQLCIRRRGEIVLNRAIGHAAGNAPQDARDAARIPCTTQTPFNIFSASKAITAMLIHKLDEERLLHLEDPVCEFIPEFARHGKHRITIRHILSHRAGIPNLPPDALDLDLLGRPEVIVAILADAKLRSRPGRLLAYHAVSGGSCSESCGGSRGRSPRARGDLEPLASAGCATAYAHDLRASRERVDRAAGPPLRRSANALGTTSPTRALNDRASSPASFPRRT